MIFVSFVFAILTAVSIYDLNEPATLAFALLTIGSLAIKASQHQSS